MNFEIGGAGFELSKHWRHRDECLFIRHRYYPRRQDLLPEDL